MYQIYSKDKNQKRFGVWRHNKYTTRAAAEKALARDKKRLKSTFRRYREQFKIIKVASTKGYANVLFPFNFGRE